MTEPASTPAIQDFLGSCRHSRGPEPSLSLESVNELSAEYFENLRRLSSTSIKETLELMKRSLVGHKRSRDVRDWEECCVGVAQYLLSKRIDGPDRVAAARSVVVLSLFFHTLIPGYLPFRPVACEISTVLWGRIIPNKGGMLVPVVRKPSIQGRLFDAVLSVLVWLVPAVFMGVAFGFMMMLKYGVFGWQAFFFAAMGGLVIGLVRVAVWTFNDRRRFN
jgi:hypothetical protein